MAERLGGKADDARRTLAEALQGRAEGPLGGEDPLRAGRRRAGRRPAAAGRGAGPGRGRDAPGPDRKDRLAEVYHAFARRLLSPDDPVSPPDPNGAYALLAKARELAKGDALRASLLFAMARAGQKSGPDARPAASGATPARRSTRSATSRLT